MEGLWVIQEWPRNGMPLTKTVYGIYMVEQGCKTSARKVRRAKRGQIRKSKERTERARKG